MRNNSHTSPGSRQDFSAFRDHQVDLLLAVQGHFESVSRACP
jgi:hypothetical protein